MGTACSADKKPPPDAEPLVEKSASQGPPARKPEKGSENLSTEEKTALIRPRKCTDCLCLLLFFVALAGMARLLHEAFTLGDIRRLYHGLNFQNQVCGVDPEVAYEPYLYWCTKGGKAMTKDAIASAGIALKILDPTSQREVDLTKVATLASAGSDLDFENPICVAECPESTETYNSCLKGITEVTGPTEPNGTFWKKQTFNFGLVQDYVSYDFAHRYCLPKDDNLLKQLNGTFSSGYNAATLKASQLIEVWPVYLIMLGVAVLLGYAYLFCIERIAGPLIYTMVLMCTILPLGGGIYFLYGAFSEDLGERLASHLGEDASLPYAPTTNNKAADIIIGAVLTLLGLGVLAFACCKRKSIDLVIGVLQCTVSVLWDLPTLLAQPLVDAIIRTLLLAKGFFGLALILSMASVTNYSGSFARYIPKGVARELQLTDEDYIRVGLYCFVWFWLWEFIVALKVFVYSYAVQLWFFAPEKDGKKRVGCVPIFRGYMVGLTFNAGSLAFGSCIMALFRAAYIVAEYLRQQAVEAAGGDDDEKKGTLNKVSQGAAACCCCALGCCESLIRYLNKGVYVVVAVESENYCAAAEQAIEMMASEIATIGLLKTVMTAIKILGMGSISGVGTLVTWLTVRNLEQFSNPDSKYFVSEPELVSVVGGAICLLVSSAFMTMFATVADTMVFSYALDKKFRKENGYPENPNIPKQLRDIMGKK
eukprot:TRINITY_DN25883_c0_g1_i1.p1 TRINITY_DN25883_c0_g1~~TRINITY_DN25883_c0_g1_i1.p1  ORF type:complete len:731 (-),score=105.76 TRINITY_DN25883_c0_g1_i1:139-2259(-)